ncbi:MAG: branched-chain amino acid ABC transporter permease [Gammaproteobacteria bacterium]|nr:MAG: branched-chain amino acid ABC transporter permease [Gammaproteobacteria bacterium]
MLKKLPVYLTPLIWLSLFVLPQFLDGYTLSQLSIYLCYGLLAMSLSLIWGQVGLLCLGQAIFFGIGAYAMSLATLDKVPLLLNLSTGQQSVGLLLAVVLPMLLAFFISLLLFNGSALDGAFLGLVTLALAVVAERFFEHWRYAGGVNGLFGVPGLMWGGRELGETAVYYVTLGLSSIVALGLYSVKYSAWGLLLKTVRENESRTNHLGVNTVRIKMLAFVASAGIAGLAGALFVTQFFFVSPNLVGFALSTEVLIWVAVGGRFSFTAAFLGAISVRLLENYLGDTFGNYWQLVLGFVFIVVVLFFPKGVFGKVAK